MSNTKLILASDKDGNDITVDQVNRWISNKSKKELADFIYSRLHGRYLKPFEYSSPEFRESYKNGFSMMASCCLLIETYVSFQAIEFRTTHGKSEKAFGYFFVTEPLFMEFSTGAVPLAVYLDRNNRTKDNGVPHDFYANVRCGILHSGETKNSWLITRTISKPLFNVNTKEINATKFASTLKRVLSNYRAKLNLANFDTDLIWQNFRNRITDIINNA